MDKTVCVWFEGQISRMIPSFLSWGHKDMGVQFKEININKGRHFLKDECKLSFLKMYKEIVRNLSIDVK